MPYLADGTFVDHNTQVGNSADAREAFGGTMNLQIGQISNTYLIDDNANISKKYVEYDVVVNEGRRTTVTYRNVRALDSFGGQNNFNEFVFQDTTTGDPKTQLLADGSWVVIACLYGSKQQAFILSGIQHQLIRFAGNVVTNVPAFSSPNRDADLQNLPTLQPGAADADGNRLFGEYNGVRWLVNQNGELTILVQGPKNPDGTLQNQKGMAAIKFNQQGDIQLLDRKGQELHIAPGSNTITLVNQNSDGIILDGKKNQLLIAATGSNNGSVSISASQAITLHSDNHTIQIGSQNSIEPLVLGNQFTVNYTALYAALAGFASALGSATSVSQVAAAGAALTGALTPLASQVPNLVSTQAFTEK